MEDVDEDLISCHVCLLRFDEELHKPKYLDCHHSFCMMCIKVIQIFILVFSCSELTFLCRLLFRI